MEHDLQAIKEAEKQGLFDSATDPQALSMTEEERSKVLSSMKDKEIKEEEEIVPYKEKKSLIKDKRKLAKKAWYSAIVSFFSKVVETIASLFKKQQSGIRHVKATLSNFNPQFINFQTEKLRKDFAYYIYDIYRIIYQIRILFKEAIIKPDEIDFSREMFLMDYINTLLSQKSEEIKNQFNPENLAQLARSSEDGKEEINKKIDTFIKQIDVTDKSTINTYCSAFEQLLFISRFNFADLFRLFDTNYNPDIDIKPIFRDANLFTALEKLKDLNVIFRSFSVEPIPENVYFHFDETLKKIIDQSKHIKEGEDQYKANIKEISRDNESDDEDSSQLKGAGDRNHKDKGDSAKGELEDMATIEKEEVERIGKTYHLEINKEYLELNLKVDDVKKAVSRIQRLNNKNIIENMIFYITENMEYGPRRVRCPHFFFKRYTEVFNTQIIEEYESIQYQINRQILVREVLSYFGIASIYELDWIENYDEEMNNKLEMRRLPHFQFSLPAAILRSFLLRSIGTIIKPIEEVLLVTGEFAEKSRAILVHDVIEELKELIEEFEKFKEEEVDDSNSSFNKLRMYITGSIPDRAFHNIAQNKIIEIDERMYDLVAVGIRNIFAMQKFLNDVVNDLGRNTPTIIRNIKRLHGPANKIFIATLRKGAEMLNNFTKIIYHYNNFEDNIIPFEPEIHPSE